MLFRSSADDSVYNAVTVDNTGNVYAGGYQEGSSTFSYGSGIIATAPYSSDSYSANVLLVKYDSVGNPLWARTVLGASNLSYASSVSVDDSGNVYAAGEQDGTGAFLFGPGVSAQGTAAGNPFIIKYLP